MSGVEQEAICLRYVDKYLITQEVFVGLYAMESTSGMALYKMLLDVLTRLSLPLSNLRGQAFDGASNMSGAYNGVQALILKEQPLAYFSHCSAHCINLVCQAVGNLIDIREAINIVHEIGLLFSRITKFRLPLQKLCLNKDISLRKLRPFCPTQWTVRYKAIKEVLQLYKHLLDSLEKVLADNTFTCEQRAKACGIIKNLKEGSNYLILSITSSIFRHLEHLIYCVENKNNTLEGILAAVDIVKGYLIQEKDMFASLYQTSEKAVKDFDLEPIVAPRSRCRPKR